jgi:hypothetical protein
VERLSASLFGNADRRMGQKNPLSPQGPSLIG